MLLLLIGLILLGLWWAGISPVAAWPWWVIALPFVLTILWWHLSDAIGLTEKRALQEADKRILERRLRAMDAMGLGSLKNQARQQHKHGKNPSRAGPAEASRNEMRH